MRLREYVFEFTGLEPRTLLSVIQPPPYQLPDVMDPSFTPSGDYPVGSPAPQPVGVDLPLSSPTNPSPTLLC
jgi:hypothetical protein